MFHIPRAIDRLTVFIYNRLGKELYKIVFYRDSNGRSPVLDYTNKLAESNGKDSRIKFNKIIDYMHTLSRLGTSAGYPYVKHLDGEIWELRPMRDRILFAEITGDRFVFLHRFMKQSQKTPAKEIRKAKDELIDFIERSGVNEKQ